MVRTTYQNLNRIVVVAKRKVSLVWGICDLWLVDLSVDGAVDRHRSKVFFRVTILNCLQGNRILKR